MFTKLSPLNFDEYSKIMATSNRLITVRQLQPCLPGYIPSRFYSALFSIPTKFKENTTLVVFYEVNKNLFSVASPLNPEYKQGSNF